MAITNKKGMKNLKVVSASDVNKQDLSELFQRALEEDIGVKPEIEEVDEELLEEEYLEDINTNENTEYEEEEEEEQETPKGKRTKINELMISKGEEILMGMGEGVKEVGSSSHTLHFITLLGLGSKRSVRRTPEGNVVSPTTIGVTLVSDKSIVVPEISVLKNKDTGIDESDIGTRRIRKGEQFHLNMYELMFLIVRTEYAGFLSYEGDPQGVQFVPKMAYYARGEAKLPTPTLTFKPGMGSIKEDMVEIDFKNKQGRWEIKPEFKKEFGELIPTKEEKVERKKKEPVPAPTAVALALGKLLEDKYNLKL